MIAYDSPTAPEPPPEPLLASLRAEIEEYGGMVALFEEQQAAILARDADRVLTVAEQLERQAAATRARRKEREAMVAQWLPEAEGKPVSIGEIMPRLREPLRPLVEALKDEINRLISHTRRRAQQNQMLLARTIETSQELLRRLNPGGATNTYSAQGRMKGRAAPRPSRLLSHS